MKQKLIKITSMILVAILISLLFINSSEALGIRPAKTTINFNEDQNYSGNFWIINNDLTNLNVKISLEGEMSEFIQLETKQLSFRKDEESKDIKFNVALPDEIPAGESYATIKVEEKTDNSDKNSVSSKIVVKHKVKIIGPYPDKYVEAKMNVHDQEGEFKIITEVENLGQKAIENIETIFYVNNQKSTISNFNAEDQSLEIGENKIVTNSISKEFLGEGEFEIVAKLNYDENNSIEIIKEITNGKPVIEISYFDQFLIAGAINLYSMELVNNWNKELENVFVEAFISQPNQENNIKNTTNSTSDNSNNIKIGSFRTKSIDINSLEREVIQDYYNAENVEEGEYLFEFIVNYWNNYKMESQNFKVNFISEDDNKNSLTGMVTLDSDEESKRSFFSGTFFKASIVIILLVTIIFIGSVLVNRFKQRDDEW